MQATAYWVTLKQSFLIYQAYIRAKLNTSEFGELNKHENRKRAVTELLLSLNPLTSIARHGYTIFTGKEPEKILEKVDIISEKILDISDATMYLTARVTLGVAKVVENGIEYGGSTIEYLAGNPEKAEEILNYNIADDLKGKLDELYGRENWVLAVGDSMEKFGVNATYIALGTLLNAGGLQAIVAGAGLVLGKAGEKTKDSIEKTGELSEKELLHGAISGVTLLAFIELGNIAADMLGENAPEIAREIQTLADGKIEPRKLKMVTESVVNGLESGIMFASYDIPEQTSKELERVFKIDATEKGNWKEVLEGTTISILSAATFTMVQEIRENKEFYSTYEERLNRTPKNNGEWTGERGESKFISNDEEANKFLKEKGKSGIEYTDAIPDFSEMSKGTVEINNMTSQRRGKGNNFWQANEKLAQLRGCKPEDVAYWMDSHGYVWHECNDMKTMQKIPFAINARFSHLGGVAECERKEHIIDNMLGRNDLDGGIFDE